MAHNLAIVQGLLDDKQRFAEHRARRGRALVKGLHDQASKMSRIAKITHSTSSRRARNHSSQEGS